MWNKFKRWLCKAEFQRMEEHLQYERKMLEEEYNIRADYLENKYRMVMMQNNRIMDLMAEKLSIDPQPPVILRKSASN